ncbi:helix-turn-helix domain-containing protein [Xylanibacter ruminicola]|nr:helix-turn-helix transcriptional regulator [Xylanibacter ruminicola]
MNQKEVDDQWLADRINISRTSVNKIINGHTDPKLSRLYQIADALEVSILELFR